MSTNSFDVVVIGSGPGGYVGAIRAAQLGFKTALIEKDSTLGGTCLNVGCIPSKALLDSSEYFAFAQKELKEHGVDAGACQLNLPNMMGRKDKIVSQLTSGVAYLLKKNKVTLLNGVGTLTQPHEVTVSGKPPITLKAQNIILATGSCPNVLPTLPYDGTHIISSTEALKLAQVPKHLVVVGAGAIGLEMGSVWLRLGSQVTVVEFSHKICGAMDGETSGKVQKILQKQGMKFLLSSQVTGFQIQGATSKGITSQGATPQGATPQGAMSQGAMSQETEVHLFYESLDGPNKGKKEVLKAHPILVAAGRTPFSEGLGLEELGIEKDPRGCVVVDSHFRTKYPHIYAIGDLISGPMLAHKAEEEGVAVAEIIAGQHGHVNYPTVPCVIYTWPEVASVGRTEEQLQYSKIPYKVGRFPFSANGRAQAMGSGSTEGQVKVLAHRDTDAVLGVHIVGPRASDMIAEAVVLMEFGGSAEDLARSFHAHPTLSEVMREAALGVDQRARQI